MSRLGAAGLVMALTGAMIVGAAVVSGRPQPPFEVAAAATLDGSGSSPASAAGSGFSISGRAAGLYPGANVPLVLTVTNQQAFAIEVTSITVRVRQANARCPGTLLSVGRFTGPLPVPAHSRAKQVLPLTMSASAGDPCQGVVFPLLFTAQAIRKP